MNSYYPNPEHDPSAEYSRHYDREARRKRRRKRILMRRLRVLSAVLLLGLTVTAAVALIDRQPEAVETPPAEEPPADAEPSAPSQNNSAALLLILLLVAGGGGAIYWFKFRGKKTQSKGDSDLDEYDFGQDDMDDEEPLDAESDEETQ